MMKVKSELKQKLAMVLIAIIFVSNINFTIC